MSCIIKGNDVVSLNAGIPCRNVSNVSLKQNDTILSINFTAPGNVIMEGIILAEPLSVDIVIGYNPPTSPTDTDIYQKLSYNISANTSYTKEINIEIEKTYYIRFFTYTKENVINSDSSSIYSIKTSHLYDPVFGNNSWDDIYDALYTNKVPETWKIGDEKTIQIDNTNYRYDDMVLEIWDFENSGIGKVTPNGSNSYRVDFNTHPKMVLGTKHIITTSDASSYYSTYNGYKSFDTIIDILSSVYNSMPNDLKSIIMHASVKVNRDDYNYSENYIIDSYEDIDKERSCMFIPSLKELNTSSSYSVDYDSYCDEFGEQFPIFTNNTSRIKNTYNVMYDDYWTRSVSKNLGGVYIINRNGESDIDSVYSNNGIIFFFCI